jgi:hypothetical protein
MLTWRMSRRNVAGVCAVFFGCDVRVSSYTSTVKRACENCKIINKMRWSIPLK